MPSCVRCSTEKEPTEFYDSDRTCKECRKRRVRENRRQKIDYYRAHDRVRSALPHRAELRKRVSIEWKATNPDHRRAQVALGNALRDGKVVRPDECEGCGQAARIEAHHHDYSKPLVVVWLCKPCHAIADKIRRKFEAA